MPIIDDINQAFRDFTAWNAQNPLPVGDPRSGVHHPSKADIRNILLAVLQATGNPDALNSLVLQIDGKADLANSGKIFQDRAAAVSAGQTNLPAEIRRILTEEGNFLVLRAPFAQDPDPLFTTSPYWGEVTRFPNILLLADKADSAVVVPRLTPSYTSRAAAVTGAADLPTSVSQILVREGTALVVRSRAATADDPLYETAPRWGVVQRQDMAAEATARSQAVTAEAAARAGAIEAEAIRVYRSNLGEYTGTATAGTAVPSVVSADDRALLSTDVVSGLSNYRVSLGEYLGRLPPGASAPSMVSADDRVLLGTASSGSVLPETSTFPIWTNDGQSNAEGATDGAYALVYPSSSPALLTLARGSARDQWLGLATGGGASFPLVGSQITDIASMSVEFAPSGHATTAAEAAARSYIRRQKAPIVIWSNAEGGQSINGLLPNPSAGFHAFANMVTALERAQAVKPAGSRLVYEWMLMAQGESNTTSESLGQLHNDLRRLAEVEARRVLGQTEALRMISWQPSSFQSASNGARSILKFALDHSDDATFFCGGPTYCFSWYEPDTIASAEFLHNSSRGHATRGELGSAIIRRVEETGRYLPLHAVAAQITGANEITVTLSEEAEVATSDIVAAIANMGVTVAGATIGSVVVSDNRVIITTTTPASGASSVSFGLTGQASPRTEARIPRTNIRAKATLGTYSWGGLIHAWMCHQQLAIS